MKVEIKCKGSRSVKLEDLKPFQGKLKYLSDENYERLRDEILEDGFSCPFHVWSTQDGKPRDTMDILDGHQRLATLLKMSEDGYDLPEEFPIVDVDASSYKQAKRKVLAMAASFGKITKDGLDEFIEDIDLTIDEIKADFSFVAMDDGVMSAVEVEELPEVSEGDYNPDLRPDPVTKKGDLWQLGRHRLLCGDSTVLTDVEHLMDGAKAGLIVTDPPYNMAYEGGTKDKLTIRNDSMENESFYDFLHAAYTNLYTITEDGAGIYVFHADREGINFRLAMVDAGWKLAQCCIWVKQSLVIGRQDYHCQHEPILYGWKETAPHRWFADRKQTTVWNFNRPRRSEDHPTMKPLDLICYPMRNSSQPGDIVVDLFLGSGATLMAADSMERTCYGMELDERYCDVIIKRWQKETGLKAIHAETGDTYDELR